ncbi:MAG: hypothetical protein GXO66_09320 [Euryarchaeota archaeon]|nr:hypothetical protein [Euryarchaeota archaeon]
MPGASGDEREEIRWRAFLAWCAALAGILMLLPLDAVMEGDGSLSLWFKVYLLSGAAVILLLGVSLGAARWGGRAEPPLPEEVDLEGLEAEDRELLRSLRQLREWYVYTAANAGGSRMRELLGVWYHMAVAREIEIRNLRRCIRQLRSSMIEISPSNRLFQKISNPKNFYMKCATDSDGAD